MKKKILSLLLMFGLLISASLVVFAEEVVENGVNMDDFSIQAIHQEYKEEIDEYSMVLTFTNNSEETVVLTGDENNQLIIKILTWPGAQAKEEFKFDLYGSVTEILVEANETKKIVEVPAGPPGTWQSFYNPLKYNDMDVVLNINDETVMFEDIYFAITGEIRHPLLVGEIVSTDNEDGTATLKFKIDAYEEIVNIVCENNACDILEEDPELIGPKTGLKTSDFAVLSEFGELIGKVIQATEINKGEYELVWQHEAGNYEGAKLNTGHGYADIYVCLFPKDDDGNFLVKKENSHERDYSFNVTITKTKEPVVIEQDEVIFETDGASNIPKIASLHFKEVTEVIPDEDMKQYNENVNKTTVNKEIVHVYDIALLVDGVEIQPDGNVKISIPLSEKMKTYVDLKVVYIDDDGTVTEVESKIIDGKIVFVTDHFSYYAVIGTLQDEELADVPKEPETPEEPEVPEDLEEPTIDEKPEELPHTGIVDNPNLLLGLNSILVGIYLVLKNRKYN